MRSLALIGVLTVLLAGAARAETTRPEVIRCGSGSIGPGPMRRLDLSGARCFLAAYRDHCRAARYELRIFGVDTVATRAFAVTASSGRCLVAVATTFRVVPQQPHATGRGTCRALRRVGSSVVATTCTGRGVPSTISLTAVG